MNSTETDNYLKYVPIKSWANFSNAHHIEYRITLFFKLSKHTVLTHPIGLFAIKNWNNAKTLLYNGKVFLAQRSSILIKRCLELILAFACHILQIRFVRFNISAFGHLALEPDLFLKEQQLGRLPKGKYLWLIDKQIAANKSLLTLWQQKIPNINIPCLNLESSFFDNIRLRDRIFYPSEPYFTSSNQTAKFGIIQKEWGGRPPTLSLPSNYYEEGYKLLKEEGFSKKDWFACIHCRGSGYHSSHPGHDFRNANIETYQKGVEHILAQGGWVIRLGDPSMAPLPKRENFIDYPHSKLRTDWMDIFLLAECKYILGSCSGPASFPAGFGKPMAMANCLPLSATPSYCHNGLGISTPKLLYSNSKGRLLTFKEILESDIGNYRWLNLYKKAGLEFVDNDDQDIFNLAKEIDAMSNHKLELSKEDTYLQKRVHSLFRPGHYGYQSECIFSPAFLKKHKELI